MTTYYENENEYYENMMNENEYYNATANGYDHEQQGGAQAPPKILKKVVDK